MRSHAVACAGDAASARQHAKICAPTNKITEFVRKSACPVGLPQPTQRHSHLSHDRGRVPTTFLGTLIGTCRTENRPGTAGLAGNQTGFFFASGRQAGRANTDWPSTLFFTDRVRTQKNVGSKTPDSEPTRKCDFFRAPPPFSLIAQAILRTQEATSSTFERNLA